MEIALSRKDTAWLELAMKIAASSECDQRHGAVVVKGGRVLATGINKNRNHPKVLSRKHLRTDSTVHAEADALSRVKNPEGCTVYVARVNNNGDPLLSLPCSNCRKMMGAMGIKRVVWTTTEEKAA